MNRLQLEIDEHGNLWEGDAVIIGEDAIRKRAKEILDNSLNHLHSIRINQFPFKRIMIFTKREK